MTSLLALVLAIALVPTGSLSVIGRTATSAIIHAEQTNTPIVRLTLTNYCYIGPYGDPASVYAGSEIASVSGSADVTFNIGTRRYKGHDLTPTTCQAILTYKLSSATEIIVAVADTLP